MYDIMGIRREDGFTLTLEGVTDEGIEIFLCKRNTTQFRFSVKRWGPNEKITDRVAQQYLLHLYWFYQNWPGNTADNIELCRAHHEDIELALLNFPHVRIFPNYQPIQEVIFEVNGELISSEKTPLS